jgi:uncharacterized protein YndB with AHSA1/START domain
MKKGKVTQETDGFRVRFERELPYDIHTVWDAISKPEKLKFWFTDIAYEPKPGEKLTITFRDPGHTQSFGEIIAFEAPYRFVFTWEGELAEWELSENGQDACKLVLTYSKLPPEYAVNAPAGFHTLLDRLEEMLAGSTRMYPFGMEENDPEHLKIQEAYGETVYADYPELLRWKPIVVEHTYHAPVKRVWEALTVKEQMKQWYFDLDEFRAEKGFKFSFYGQGHKGEKYLHLCEVTEVEPLKKLSYSWAYEGYDGISHVSFELWDEGEETRLKLTHKGLGSFPMNNADFARESFHGGWTELIGKLLKDFVEN